MIIFNRYTLLHPWSSPTISYDNLIFISRIDFQISKQLDSKFSPWSLCPRDSQTIHTFFISFWNLLQKLFVISRHFIKNLSKHIIYVRNDVGEWRTTSESVRRECQKRQVVDDPLCPLFVCCDPDIGTAIGDNCHEDCRLRQKVEVDVDISREVRRLSALPKNRMAWDHIGRRRRGGLLYSFDSDPN